MTTEWKNRQGRPATILAADIVQFSRMLDTDEEGNYTAQKVALSEVIDPGIKKHKGRIVTMTRIC